MNNTFNFSYFVPTPDTTANCALSRWNDSLMGLSDFLKAYMSSRQSLEFGFSRNLNISELLNLSKETVYDKDEKRDYAINYLKYGDLKANICGFEIPLVDYYNPFLKTNWMFDHYYKVLRDTSHVGDVLHVFNYKNSGLTKAERIDATKLAFNNLKYDIENVMSDSSFAYYFGQSTTKQTVIANINNQISRIESMSSDAQDFIFGYDSTKNLKDNINTSVPNTTYSGEVISLNNTSLSLYRDFCYVKTIYGNYPYSNFVVPGQSSTKSYLLEKYFCSQGIDVILGYGYYDVTYKIPKYYHNDHFNKNHIFVYFKFFFNERPTITPFISHDGTKVPLSKQEVQLTYSMFTSTPTGNSYDGQFYNSTYWDADEECPIYYDINGNPQLMTLENNIDGMGGRDYTVWSSPVQKTENGYQFECCMPLAFYNEATDSYGNEYYATKPHDGVEVGQVMYRVPVVKRMRQNIEEAIVNTHLTKCLNDLVPANNQNSEEDDTVVLGGVVVDDFTEGLYPVAETQEIATETKYGEVKIVKIKDEEGNNNGVLDLMYHYSETGELSYDGMTMPEIGRAVDIITMFDVLKALNNDQTVSNGSFVINGINPRNVDIKTPHINFDSQNLSFKNESNLSNLSGGEDLSFSTTHSVVAIERDVTSHTNAEKTNITVSAKEQPNHHNIAYSILKVSSENWYNDDECAGRIELSTCQTSYPHDGDVNYGNYITIGGLNEGINIHGDGFMNISSGNVDNNSEIRFFGSDTNGAGMSFLLSQSVMLDDDSVSEKGFDFYCTRLDNANVIVFAPNFTVNNNTKLFLGTNTEPFSNFYCENIEANNNLNIKSANNTVMVAKTERIYAARNPDSMETPPYAYIEASTTYDSQSDKRTGLAGLSIADENNFCSAVFFVGNTLSTTDTDTIHALYPNRLTADNHKIYLGTQDNPWDCLHTKNIGSLLSMVEEIFVSTLRATDIYVSTLQATDIYGLCQSICGTGVGRIRMIGLYFLEPSTTSPGYTELGERAIVKRQTTISNKTINCCTVNKDIDGSYFISNTTDDKYQLLQTVRVPYDPTGTNFAVALAIQIG